jgi:hypothetical protein
VVLPVAVGVPRIPVWPAAVADLDGVRRGRGEHGGDGGVVHVLDADLDDQCAVGHTNAHGCHAVYRARMVMRALIWVFRPRGGTR